MGEGTWWELSGVSGGGGEAYNKGATSRRIEPRRPNLFFTRRFTPGGRIVSRGVRGGSRRPMMDVYICYLEVDGDDTQSPRSLRLPRRAGRWTRRFSD